MGHSTDADLVTTGDPENRAGGLSGRRASEADDLNCDGSDQPPHMPLLWLTGDPAGDDDPGRSPNPVHQLPELRMEGLGARRPGRCPGFGPRPRGDPIARLTSTPSGPRTRAREGG